ncbi:uncharacterized protein LOC122067541 [Macadamia integrifolia]|uniref:uncharacterized protein LOC122067541 n=1 Tax=Macadamia integrifolia TaxID=60698 RepID=UPI001C4E8ED8|nr:uncharacterized protein LOC122067541 [Macadamia integrifolia]
MPPSRNRAEFLSRSAKMDSQRALWNSPKRSFAWSDSPTKVSGLAKRKAMVETQVSTLGRVRKSLALALLCRTKGESYEEEGEILHVKSKQGIKDVEGFFRCRKSTYGEGFEPQIGLVLPHTVKGPQACQQDRDYYSTFHSVPYRKRFSKNEYEDFTRESTRQGIAELASSPDFTNWVVENASRIQLLPDDSLDDSMESGSGSSEETVVEGGSGLNLFKWY